VVTPFNRGGDIDEGAYRAEVRYLAGLGVHGLSPGGSVGEGAALTDEELARLVTLARAEVARGLPILAGIIRTSAQAAISAARAAELAGADALMVTPPFYNILVPDEDGVIAYFREIADAVPVPIVIYNVVPQTAISADLFTRLLNIERIVGIKQALGGPMATYEQIRVNGARGLVFSANDEVTATTFVWGADGAISSLVSAFPDLCLRMWALVGEGRLAEALALQDALFPLWRVVRGPQFPVRLKTLLRLLGRAPGQTRGRMGEPEPGFEEKLADHLRRLNGLLGERGGAVS